MRRPTNGFCELSAFLLKRKPKELAVELLLYDILKCQLTYPIYPGGGPINLENTGLKEVVSVGLFNRRNQ
jgi:hypothetical protein